MIKEKYVKIVLNSSNVQRLCDLGYSIPQTSTLRVKLSRGYKMGTTISIKIEHVPFGSKTKVTRICDVCGTEKIIHYREAVKAPLCKKCALKGKRNPFYGKKHSLKTRKRWSKEKRKCSDSKELEILDFLEKTKIALTSDYMAKKIGLAKQTILNMVNRHNRRDLLAYKSSGREAELVDFIKENYLGEVRTNDRTILKPRELDIYLPDLRLAFEFNGLYWHSEKFTNKYIHQEKWEKCRDQGITLYTIWSYQWGEAYKVLVKKLLSPSKILYARKTTITRDPAKLEAFLKTYHIQGIGNYSEILGLEVENEVVAALTIRPHHRGLKETVLSRVCFGEYSVVGGLPKMLKALEYTGMLYTWSDNSYAPNPTLYRNAGFEVIAKVPIDYFYTKGDDVYLPKQAMRKSVIGCPKDVREADFLKNLGCYRVWDCGKLKWCLEIK